MDNLYKIFIMNKKSKGFTLIELTVVIVILTIITVIAVPRLVKQRGLAAETVCDINRNTVERLYMVFLLENGHEDNLFTRFLIENFDEVCPDGGVINYEDGKVKCSLHEEANNDEDESPGDEVPWI